jgi:hypothetical protein
MKLLLKNYLFLILIISIILVHQLIFQSFFPNKNFLLGNDYSQFLPNFIFGNIWFVKNFLSIPWFTPSTCCGVPFFGDPQTMFYSFQQLIFLFFGPITALKIMFLFFSLIGFFGTFFLLNKSFNKNIYISLIAASLFLFNGFFNYRAIIGHVAYLSYVFIPLYCFFLINSFENKKDKLKSIFYILISSVLFANFIHSGSGPIILIISFSISLVVSIYIYLNEKFGIINYLILSLIIGFLISSSKIVASLSFLSNFPREFPPQVFGNYYDYVTGVFQSLFLYPDILKHNAVIINSLPFKIDIHEIEFGITILPLIIFAIFIFNLKKITFNKLNSKKILALLFIFVIVIFITAINVSENSLGNFLHNLPVFKSTWVHPRLNAVYIFPIIIVSSLLLDKISFNEKNLKIFTIFCLFIISLQNYNYNKDFYHKQNYNPESFEKIHINKEKIKNLKIKDIVLITDKNNKILTNRQRNNLFIHELSPLFCYQPLFGYQLEFMPKNNLKFDKKNKISENLFYYTGNPKSVVEDKLNFLNPSCFIFPKENNCMPGDMFKKTQINELENFLNYKAFKFKLSKLQKIFNYISLISLIFSIFFIAYYLIKKIIFNKSSDEQNH